MKLDTSQAFFSKAQSLSRHYALAESQSLFRHYVRFFDCALRSYNADDGGFGGLPPKLKIKVRALARFTEFLKKVASCAF